MNKEKKKLIKYINNKVNNLIIEDKKYLFNTLAPYINIENVYEEAEGIRMMYKHIELYHLQDIAEYIKKNIYKTEIDFSSID